MEDDPSDQVWVDRTRRLHPPAGRLLDLAQYAPELGLGQLGRSCQVDVEDALLVGDEPLEVGGDLADLRRTPFLHDEPLFKNFLLLTAEKGRAGELDEVAREFERLMAREERRLTVELTTARELTDAEAKAIVEQIEKAAGRKVEATRSVDPDLVGGIVLQAGSYRVDASVRGRLQRLRQELVKT